MKWIWPSCLPISQRGPQWSRTPVPSLSLPPWLMPLRTFLDTSLTPSLCSKTTSNLLHCSCSRWLSSQSWLPWSWSATWGCTSWDYSSRLSTRKEHRSSSQDPETSWSKWNGSASRLRSSRCARSVEQESVGTSWWSQRRSHALAMKLYQIEFPRSQQGRVDRQWTSCWSVYEGWWD